MDITLDLSNSIVYFTLLTVNQHSHSWILSPEQLNAFVWAVQSSTRHLPRIGTTSAAATVSVHSIPDPGHRNGPARQSLHLIDAVQYSVHILWKPQANMRTAAVHQLWQRINDAFRKFTSRESFACQNGVLRRTGVARLGRLTSAAGKQPSLSGSRPHHHHHQPGRFSSLGDCLRSARCFFHNLSEFLVCMLVKPVSIGTRVQ